MLFDTLVETYDKLESTTKRLEMTDILTEIFKIADSENIDKIIYMTQGKIHPDWKGEPEIGMAEKMVKESLIRVTGLKKAKVESMIQNLGDIGLAAEEAMTKKTQSGFFSKQLSVVDIYNGLDNIARRSGTGSAKQKMDLLGSLLTDSSPLGARYLSRMVEGKLRMGIGDMTILDALAQAFTGSKDKRPELERAYNLSSDLGAVAITLVELGIDGVLNFKIKAGAPIRVMAAQRLSNAEEIIEKLGGHCSAEYKLDGERFQIHKDGDDINIFSRRLENITHMYPDAVKLTIERIKVEKAIIEGEAVAFNPETGEDLPFQTLMKRRRKHKIKEMMAKIPVRVYLFDCLYDGEDLTLKPYPFRIERLDAITDRSEEFKPVERLETSDPEELDRFFQQSLSDGTEGLIVKSTSDESIYRAGARSWLWVKLKRSYQSKMQDHVDLAVVGAFFGRGRRAGSYGALLVAAYDPSDDKFKTVCKVGTGFTDENLEEMQGRLNPYRSDAKPINLDSLLEAEVWFDPIVVMEVLGDEITASPMHLAAFGEIRKDAGLAIRFPRFTRWREDKSADEVTQVGEILDMYNAQLKTL
ncbi:ATP-dependent DNA ligase [Candidatus Bathyarchaeota archaeon]|nr:ATP-dependent DNA ligase [Candidatus Bathyarchaeota archaeon]MBT4319471.1 ATP-dependent DNA ligase [Candidatus Bathyarchaeota archaeon]MBT4423226.1 ATP-dependent DNA ligase [Candidatus Bathyarchaeota archaeon]MBT6603579.1 ATP-dependent DNA ligase [Candidatus Bathyarchaeota archaeon]MBT7186776.1 ATP-dependent DNA ligase [Candidatus Bathyarchaeota archaeon]